MGIGGDGRTVRLHPSTSTGRFVLAASRCRRVERRVVDRSGKAVAICDPCGLMSRRSRAPGDPVVNDARPDQEIVESQPAGVDRAPQQPDGEGGAEDRPGESSNAVERSAGEVDDTQTHHLHSERSTARRPTEGEVRDEHQPPDQRQRGRARVGPTERSRVHDEGDPSDRQIAEQHRADRRGKIEGCGKEP
jgi:hypothetical protein